MKRSQLKRTTPLKRGPGPKPRRKPLRGPTDRERSEAFATGKKPCVICNAAAIHSKAHHIITQQELRKVALRLGRDLESIRWDRRNRLWLCERHHTAHHSRMKPITWAVLEQHAPKVFQFARELGLTPWLERTYPRLTVVEDAA